MKTILLAIDICVAIALLPNWALAQSAPAPAGNSGAVGDTVEVEVPLQLGGSVKLLTNGMFGASASGVNVTGIFAGSGASASSKVAGQPPAPPSVPIVDFGTLEAEITQTRAAHCLTIAYAAPCDEPTVPSGAFNIVSTDVSIAWLVDQEVQAAWKDVPLPGIALDANPPEGLAQLDSWFWVDRNTYGGQAFSEPVHLPVPWTLDYDMIVHHHDTSNGPCPNDPTHNCPTSHDWDETVHTHQNHLDVVDVTVTLAPAQYAWDFGDDSDGPWRASSHASFAGNSGLGVPYTDPYHASTVIHRYSESSLKVFEAGGFPVRLTATWSASVRIRATRDGAVVQSETRTLPARTGQYVQRYQVRESWPVLVSANGAATREQSVP